MANIETGDIDVYVKDLVIKEFGAVTKFDNRPAKGRKTDKKKVSKTVSLRKQSNQTEKTPD